MGEGAGRVGDTESRGEGALVRPRELVEDARLCREASPRGNRCPCEPVEDAKLDLEGSRGRILLELAEERCERGDSFIILSFFDGVGSRLDEDEAERDICCACFGRRTLRVDSADPGWEEIEDVRWEDPERVEDVRRSMLGRGILGSGA
jgi:hypothetical protein